MNREIKFRVWDIYSHRFLEDNGDFRYFRLGTPYEFREVATRPDKFEIQQFTGLKDKNGKEIYEGDITNSIKRGVAHGPEREYIKEAEVWYSTEDLQYVFGKYCNNGYAWHYSMADDLFDFEVVGNIFENPELLK